MKKEIKIVCIGNENTEAVLNEQKGFLIALLNKKPSSKQKEKQGKTPVSRLLYAIFKVVKYTLRGKEKTKTELSSILISLGGEGERLFAGKKSFGEPYACKQTTALALLANSICGEATKESENRPPFHQNKRALSKNSRLFCYRSMWDENRTVYM